MANFEQIYNAITDFITLKDTYQNSYDATTDVMALNALDKACEAYKNNPSAETAQAVKDANNNFIDKVKDFFSEAAPAGQGDLAGNVFDGFDELRKRTEDAISLEYNERMKKSKDHYKDPAIDTECKASYDFAKNFLPRYDPLTFDLDGDGIETVGVSATNPILFDHDGDGIKNGTGWVSADDGMLVLDRNGNGTIDSGRELFGDNTILTTGSRAGQKAKDGFDALADIDSNADGIINANDNQFSNLRIWRDLNQDGVSQSNELFTLNSQNIASINVTSTQNNQTLTNGNQLADLGTYTKLDGTQGTVGETLNTTTSNPTGNLGDINLASDTFHRTFPNVLDTSTVAHLPDMGGSGAVRDLREAANDEMNYTAGVREGTLAYGGWRVAA